ncbi:PepSY domain-containing protein [Suttonella ornithocola]|uniref:Sulfite reductase [NADPH] flavoprotein alpha-component n=1 Tax=Suttonella ornithocola TaxID=279832 RepID=A0A380MQG1_9GAMM|nr:PepSY domain-containing protein [Suttonella ornithocola]SUO93951.1 Sulfite reductase [NADPH] flavoprotein alpha-component [Suttonella ornithocola]
MWRRIHLWTGLALAVLVITMAGTGTFLATQPLYEAYQVRHTPQAQSVAEVIEKIAKANSRITPQRLKISPAGEANLSYSRNNHLRETNLSLETGKFLPKRQEPKLYGVIKDFHRSFFLGEKGRLLPALAGIAMAFLTLSGCFLLVRRMGGWRQILSRVSWRGAGNLHAAVGRLAILPLIVTVLTSLWLSAVTFHWVSDGSDKPPAYPESREQLDPVKPWTLQGLKEIPIAQVKEIIYPVADDWFDVWTVQTDNAYIFVDQFSGEVLKKEPLALSARIYDWVMLLHTGEGTRFWAVILLLSSLTVPLFAVTGVMIWWRNQRNKVRLRHNASAAQAEILLLVGSEHGSTWQFAKALHDALHDASFSVRTIEMNALASHYPKLRYLLVLTATYGDGDAPASGKRFLSRLETLTQDEVKHATLAFGDKAFPAFCAFGQTVDAALTTKFGSACLPLTYVDRQSAQTFHHWCGLLSEPLGKSLAVHYQAKRPKTQSLKLINRQIYGEAVNAPIGILTFEAVKKGRYQAGDLLAIYPPVKDAAPRYYSMGAKHSEPKIELCVRWQPDGLCSNWLCTMPIGDCIEVVVEENHRFHLPKGRRPVVMIGAGTGIAPFIGMIRQNHTNRIVDLYWGGRHPESDALYQTELAKWQEIGRLHRCQLAWSRIAEKQYVQQLIHADGEHILARLRDGAVIMVCGGQAMAAAVRNEIEQLVQTLGSSVAELKRRKRYLEDVY